MIRHLYADNFRCFSNLHVSLGEISLLMGENGAGKSSLLDLLAKLRMLISRPTSVGEVFPPHELCRWSTRRRMEFRLSVVLPDLLSADPTARTEYGYHLLLLYPQGGDPPYVGAEQLDAGGQTLLVHSEGLLTVVDGKKTGPAGVRLDTTRSALGAIEARDGYLLLGAFKRFIADLVIVALEPRQMVAESRSEERLLSRSGGDYVSWYRYLSQEHQDRVFELTAHLRDVAPGFRSFRLTEAGLDARALRVGYAEDESENITEYLFSELSDGQRALFALYTMLYGVPPGRHALFLDEPVNYVALAEIQPWLVELSDACGQQIPQAVLASHHPELLNYLGREHGIILERAPNGPTQVRYGLADDGSGLDPAECVARGWVGE